MLYKELMTYSCLIRIEPMTLAATAVARLPRGGPNGCECLCSTISMMKATILPMNTTEKSR